MTTREANYRSHCVEPPAEAREYHDTIVSDARLKTEMQLAEFFPHFVASRGITPVFSDRNQSGSNPVLMNEFQFVGESSPDECAPAATPAPSQVSAAGANNLTGAA